MCVFPVSSYVCRDAARPAREPLGRGGSSVAVVRDCAAAGAAVEDPGVARTVGKRETPGKHRDFAGQSVAGHSGRYGRSGSRRAQRSRPVSPNRRQTARC
ncbi:hypothetical protein GCM10010326_09910 [Streptomyces xanthochromogenes]|uniref:Uncharacterized protein n=1 Tax=Streptomyces xanthochromogenes TaxID=67384 RepID=A0ABQ2ZMG3_9ACTN|nr:hypothetical protein GCM10010326_09910 [Streptomyces xanthochromogenes]